MAKKIFLGFNINVKVENNFFTYNKNINYNYITQPQKYSYGQDTVSFTGLVKPAQINDVVSIGKKRLIKQFDQILETIPKNLSDEELEEIFLNRCASFERGIINQIAKLEQRAIELNKNAFSMKPQQYMNMRNELLKELNKVKKLKPEINIASGNKDNINDYELINKFKSAVMNDDFDLRKVFVEHYSRLKDMKTIEEVKETYPDIILPIRPEIVIADKIVSKSLNRDFFEKLYDLIENKKSKETDEFVRNALSPVLKSLQIEKYNIKGKDFVQKIQKKLYERIAFTLKKINKQNSFSFIPINIKQKGDILSPDDYKLISIDFDKFVLETLREQYLNFAKLRDIKSQGVDAFSIKDRDYKFEKINTKVLSLISDGMDLKKTQRNYDKFSQEQFIDRLYFYTERYADDERVFERLLDFGTCRFEGEDVAMCSRFLRELDSVFDNEKTMDEALDVIKREDIRPKGTEKINEEKYQQALQTMKTEQKQKAQLRNVQEIFDKIVNVLYKNNMTYAAGICSKYRPKSLNLKDLETSEYLMRIVVDEISKGGKIADKARLDAKISRWSTYNEYLTNGVNDEILRNAQKYATKNSKTDILEAGKYIINQELVNSYPKSLEYAKNKDVLKLVMDMSDKNKACEYLCKFSSYSDMSEKTKILEIMKHFDMSDDVDKEMLRIICENHYSKVDTTVKSKINSGGKTVDATITAGAKQEITEYFKFPAYLEFLPAFEKALSTHTTAKGNSGIKIFGSNNNAQVYEMEIKIKFKNSVARLVSTNNDYVFDKFIPLGFH